MIKVSLQMLLSLRSKPCGMRAALGFMLGVTAWGLFGFVSCGHAATLPRKLAFYVVKPAGSAPTSEGVLSDESWAAADVAADYYEYWKPNPGPGKLHTEFRMLYSDRGIHIKITNFDKGAERLRGKITRGDDPELWKEDCAQIYFDPGAKGIGYVNFTVNLLGTRADMKRLDAAVTLPEWSGDEWTARAKMLSDRWVIEAFFPWTDLGSTGREGDVWMFDHVRFAWQNEQLTAVTWAPGGNYSNPRFFGYLYFAGKGPVSYENIARDLDQVASPPWMIPVGENVLVAKDENGADLVSVQDFVAAYRAEMEHNKKRFESLEAGGGRSFALKLSQQAEALAGIPSIEAFQRIDEVVETARQFDDLYWKARIEDLFEPLAGQ